MYFCKNCVKIHVYTILYVLRVYKFNLSKRKVVKDENFQNRQKITH